MFWGREGVDSDGPLNKGVGSRVRGDECGSGETHVPGEEPMEARSGRGKADSGTGEKGLDLGQKRLKSPGFLQRDQKGPGGDKFAAQAQAQGGRKGPREHVTGPVTRTPCGAGRRPRASLTRRDGGGAMLPCTCAPTFFHSSRAVPRTLRTLRMPMKQKNRTFCEPGGGSR